MDKHDRLEILMEEQGQKLDFLIEGFSMFKDVPSDIRQLKEDMVEVKSDIRIIKETVRDHSLDICELKLQVHTH